MVDKPLEVLLLSSATCLARILSLLMDAPMRRIIPLVKNFKEASSIYLPTFLCMHQPWVLGSTTAKDINAQNQHLAEFLPSFLSSTSTLFHMNTLAAYFTSHLALGYFSFQA